MAAEGNPFVRLSRVDGRDNGSMRETWDQRIQRATTLARGADGARTLLTFYADLLALQKQLGDYLRACSHVATGSLERDVAFVRDAARVLLHGVAMCGPPPLADEACDLLAGGDAAFDDMLLAYWHSPSDGQFFAKAAVQPYADWLAERGIRPLDRDLPRSHNWCPVCGGAPQVAVLEHAAEGDGGARSLLCATCLTRWPSRRVVCAHCGEEDEQKLAYFQTPSFDHLRLDVCHACRHYLKTVDRTRLGVAVPVVDELAGASLDLCARDRGFQKVELNLVGL
jgi:hypothetical protein